MSVTNLSEKILLTISAAVLIGLGLRADYISQENKKEKELIAYQRKVDRDELTDLVILDQKGNRTILFGQTDGTYKNLQEILRNKKEENEKEYEILSKSYKGNK